MDCSKALRALLAEEETTAFRETLERVVQRWIDVVSGHGIDGAKNVEEASRQIAANDESS